MNDSGLVITVYRATIARGSYVGFVCRRFSNAQSLHQHLTVQGILQKADMPIIAFVEFADGDRELAQAQYDEYWALGHALNKKNSREFLLNGKQPNGENSLELPSEVLSVLFELSATGEPIQTPLGKTYRVKLVPC